MELRDYQTECVNAVLKSPSRKNLGVLPTGGGKTVIASAIMSQIPGRSLFIAHRKELLEQTMETIYKYDPTLDPGLVMAGNNECDNRVVVASIQTIKNKKRMDQLGDFDMVIIDEAHHSHANSYKRILYRYGFLDIGIAGRDNVEGIDPMFSDTRNLLGITATPERTATAMRRRQKERQEYLGEDAEILYDHHESLNYIFNHIAFKKSTIELIRDGWLCDFKCITRNTKIDLSKARVTRGDLNMADVANVFAENSGLLFGDIRQAIEIDLHDRDHIIIFMPGVPISIKLAEYLNRCGIPTDVIYDKLKRDDRAGVINGFKAGGYRVLINCMILTEGFDCPHIDGMIIVRPTQSPTLIMQMLGRGLRIADGKEDCIIVDMGFQRRKEDLVSTSSENIFGSYTHLHIDNPDLSIQELIELSELRAAQFPHIWQMADIIRKVIPDKEIRNRKGVAIDDLIADAEDEVMEQLQEYTAMDTDTVELIILTVNEAHNLDMEAFAKNLFNSMAKVKYGRGEMITAKQARYLDKGFGIPVELLVGASKADASALINTLQSMEVVAKSWGDEEATQRQKDYIKSLESELGIRLHIQPVTKGEASKMITYLSHNSYHIKHGVGGYDSNDIYAKIATGS